MRSTTAVKTASAAATATAAATAKQSSASASSRWRWRPALKNIVVTGGAGNIGLAIAKRFARDGANVVLAGRTLEKLERALPELQAVQPWTEVLEGPQAHSAFQMDVREASDWDRLVEQHGDIDVLVNCAGEVQRALLFRTNPAAVDALLATNLRSVIYGSKAVAQQIVKRRKAGGGCIINVSSLLAVRSEAGTSVYAAAKAGQVAFTASLAKELGRFNIRVNAILPGYIDGDVVNGMAQKDAILNRIPLRRFGTPGEVADAAAFLAKNQYANNCVLNLDGGLSA